MSLVHYVRMDQTNRTTQNILDNSAHFKGLNKNYYKLLLDVKSALVSIQTAAAAAADGIFFIVHRVKDQMHRLNSMTKKKPAFDCFNFQC